MESISSAGVVELRIHVSVNAIMSGLWFVGKVVECGNMFRGEHGASIEGVDEEVCSVGVTWIRLNIPQRSSVAVSKER